MSLRERLNASQISFALSSSTDPLAVSVTPPRSRAKSAVPYSRSRTAMCLLSVDCATLSLRAAAW